MSKEPIKFAARSFNRAAVDSEKRIIREVVLIEPNREATGHGMFVDQTMVDQVVSKGQNGPEVGFKARFDHPNACFSSMGSQLGRLKNFKKNDKGQAIADLHIGEFTKDAQFDMGKWLLSVAEEDPDQVGFSICFTQAEPEMFEAGEGDDPNSPEFLFPHARIDSFLGADVVDQGAATSSLFEDGIMGRPQYMKEQIERWANEKPEIVRTIMEPLLNAFYKNKSKESTNEIKENINQKSIQMSDEKISLTEDLKGLFKKHFSSEEEVVEQTIESDEVNADVEALNADIEAKDTALAEANEKIEELKEAAKSQEVAFSEALDAIKADFEAFKKQSIGDTVEPLAGSDAVNLSEEALEAQAETNTINDMLFWANEQATGNTVSATYKNSLNK